MTKAIMSIYVKYRQLSDTIDEKDEKGELLPWQVDALRRLAVEADEVLAGCRRKGGSV